MDEREIMQRLQDPFLPDEIEWRVGSTNSDKTKGIALAYVTNRAIQNRLDEVFGAFGWRNEFREWKEKSQLCGISVKVDGEWITKWDGADDSNMEAVKGGLSDAMKRAAYQWGIGRYLYNLDSVWVELVPAGKSHKMKAPPKLPEWALPTGFTEKKPEKLEPPASLKAKYQLGKGSMDGFEKWVDKMTFDGRTFADMEHILQERLNQTKETKESA